MSTAAPQRPKRKWRWWIVPLLVLGLMGMVGFCAVHFLAPTKGYDDSELIDQASFRSGRVSSKEIRAQAGEERFWRSIKSCIRGRPADWEVRFQYWLAAKNGSQSRWLRAVIDKLLPPFEERWRQRDNRLRTALMIVEMDLKETATPVLPELIGLADSSHYIYAASGIRGLAMLRENASPALPALFRRLARPGPIGPQIVDAISVIDPKGSRSTLQFINLLQKTTDRNRAAILPIIGRHARLQPELATNLWPALQHTNRDVVLAAVRGLAVSRQLTSVRLESFRVGFHSDDLRSRWLSLNLVSAAWPNAGPFLPELREAALHKSADQPTALTALRAMLSADVLKKEQRLATAEALIASDSPDNAWEALSQLGPLGAATNQMASLVTEALAHPNERVRAKAAEMLGQLGPAARSALPQLRALRQDKWKMVRDAVELALPKIDE